MLSPRDCGLRYEIGVDKLMWGSDYPHLEGTWPHTREKMNETFAQVEDDGEIRDILGLNAARVFYLARRWDRAAEQYRQIARIDPESKPADKYMTDLRLALPSSGSRIDPLPNSNVHRFKRT